MVVALVLLGAGLRAWQYASRPPYWHDEAALALNVFEKPARDLATRPLDAVPEAPQAAAPLFLLAQRGAHLAFGRSELGMRLLPLAMGLASLALFAAVAWRGLPPPAAALAVAMFALSARLIEHANEAKQYAGDVLACVVLLAIARPRDNGHDDNASSSATARLVWSAAVTAVGIWLSHPVAFVFGGISLALLPAVVRRERRGGTWVACNALVAASFVALYAVSIRTQLAGALFAYWAEEFVPWSRPADVPWWLVESVSSVCNYALNLAGPVLLLLAVLGAWGLWAARRTQWAAMLVAPAALVLLAAAVHRYPMGGRRLTLFLAPMVFLLAATGLAAARDRLAPRVGRWWVAIPAYLVAVAVWGIGGTLFGNPERGDIRPAVRYVLEHRRPGEAVYTTKTSELLTYWPGRPPETHFVDRPPRGRFFEPDTRRFWFVASYHPGRHESAVGPLVASICAVADRRGEFRTPAGTAMLFELRDDADGADDLTLTATTRPSAAPVATAPPAGRTTASTHD